MTTDSNHTVSVRPSTTDDVAFMVEPFLSLAYQRNPTGDGVNVDAIEHGTRASTLEQVQGMLEDSTTYVIEADGQHVGRLRVVRPTAQIEIAGLQVLPDFQNRGIGTAVVNALVLEGQARSVPVVLQVEKDNPSARRLYRRLGFEEFDETPDTYWMRTAG